MRTAISSHKSERYRPPTFRLAPAAKSRPNPYLPMYGPHSKTLSDTSMMVERTAGVSCRRVSRGAKRREKGKGFTIALLKVLKHFLVPSCNNQPIDVASFFGLSDSASST